MVEVDLIVLDDEEPNVDTLNVPDTEKVDSDLSEEDEGG